MHHHVGWFVRGAARSSKEEACVAVHGCLMRWDRAVEFPDYDRFRMVEEVVAESGDRMDDGDAEGGELLWGTDAGVEEETRGVDCTRTEDGFFAGVERELRAGLQGYIDACYGQVGHVDPRHPGVGKDGQVRSRFMAAKDGMDICYA